MKEIKIKLLQYQFMIMIFVISQKPHYLRTALMKKIQKETTWTVGYYN